MANMHAGDVGTNIIVTVKDQDDNVLNLSSATTKDYIIRKPSGTKMTKAASLLTDGSDGKLKYTTITDDVPEGEDGDWKLQVELALSYWSGKSSIATFTVDPNL